MLANRKPQIMAEALTHASLSKTLEVKNDRKAKPANKKKMGGGQKGVWSNLAKPLEVPKIDVRDPNYDSENEENVTLVPTVVIQSLYRENEYVLGKKPKLCLSEMKKEVKVILEEYFTNGDTEEVLDLILGLDSEAFHYEVVKRAISMSLDMHEKEREMVSKLLSMLYPKCLSMAQIGKGFERLLESIDDLRLDTPNVDGILATFLARAVVDEILPPKFLMDTLVIQIGGSVVDNAKKKLSIHHGSARLEKGWGPGDGRSVEQLKIAVDQLLQEYLLSNDVIEASRCVGELNVPNFHHEVIKRAITNGMESNNIQSMVTLCAHFIQQEIVSMLQLKQGIERVQSILPDISLDVPDASNLFQEFNTKLNNTI